jgi:hypothetical protein
MNLRRFVQREKKDADLADEIEFTSLTNRTQMLHEASLRRKRTARHT